MLLHKKRAFLVTVNKPPYEFPLDHWTTNLDNFLNAKFPGLVDMDQLWSMHFLTITICSLVSLKREGGYLKNRANAVEVQT